MEAEAREAGLVQSLNPLSKLLVTVFYLVVLLSFHRYDLAGVLLMGGIPSSCSRWAGSRCVPCGGGCA